MSGKKSFWPDLGAVLLIGGAVASFFWPAVLLRGAFFVQDVMVQNHPFRHFFAQALKECRLPLWDPAINCGFPLFAEGQAGVLYPFNLLTYLLMSTYAALDWNIVFHLWWAGIGTHLFLRAIGTGRVPALSGGLAYACSGYLVVRVMSPNFTDVCAWMPFLFLLIELALRRRRLLYLVLGGGVVGLQLLAGHPQAAAYGLLAALLYGAYRGILQRAGWRYFAWLVLGIPLLGAGVAAVQLLPTAELVGLSARGGGLSWDQFVRMSLPPERLITLLLPDFYGNSASGTYWGRQAGFFIQLCAYVGVLPLMLALAALRSRRDAYVGFFCALCGAGLLLSLGRFTAIFSFLYEVPGMDFFRIPTRFLLWFAFGAAVLAGLGLDRLLSGAAWRRGGWGTALILAGLGAGMAWLNRDLLLGGAPEGSALLARYRGELIFDLGRLALMGVAGGWILSGGRGARIGALLAPLLIWADLYSFGRDFNGFIEPEVYQQVPASARAILEDAGPSRTVPPRVLGLVSERNAPYDWHGGWKYDRSSYQRYPETLRMYTAGLYGLANVLPGWSPLHLRRHWEFMRGYPAFADLAGVEYVVSWRPLSGPGLEEIHDGEVRVYRNLDPVPRARLVGEFWIIGRARERLRFLRSRRFDPERQVVLEERPSFEGGGAPGQVRVVRYGLEEVLVRLEENPGGLLVLSDTYYPGWKAYVDGRERRILRADHVFRAVEVPPGAREVLFRFEPASFWIGAWVSGVCCLLMAALLWWGFRSELRVGRSLPDEAGSLAKVWTFQVILIFLVHALATRWPLWVQALERSQVLRVWGGG